MLPSEFGGVGDRGLQVLLGQAGVAGEDLRGGDPRGEVVEDDGHHDPCAPNACPHMADGRVDRDSGSPIHFVRLPRTSFILACLGGSVNDAIGAWWREHRTEAPGLFVEGLAAAFDLLGGAESAPG